MAPSRPPASRSSSRASEQFHDSADERQAQQAGRSTGTIAAQASAQSLREASRPLSRLASKSKSSPNLLRKKSRQQPQIVVHGDSTLDATPEHPPASVGSISPQPQPRGITVPSSLNPMLSDSASPSNSREHSGEGASALHSTDPGMKSKTATAAGSALAAQMAASSSQASKMRYPGPFPPEMLHTDSTLSLTRQTTPRSVRDLGSDYTRYFSPFISRNNSQQDVSTPLPRFNSTTHLLGPTGVSSTDLRKRLSDPFADEKRLSNPFDSHENTAPGTPQQRNPPSPIPEKEAATEMVMADQEKNAATHAVVADEEKAAAAAAVTSTQTSKPGFIREVDPEKAGFFEYMDDRLAAPGYAFPLFTDQKEDDDDMHMPQWDDDVKMKPKFKDHFTRENIVSTFGLFFMMAGLLCIFVVLPVVSYTGTSLLDYNYETPLDQMGGPWQPPQQWSYVSNATFPLFSNMRRGLIDPDTPESAKTKTSVNGTEYVLVFSDEFNAKNRSFYPGDDPYWYGFDGWYGATQDLEWYDPDAINTGDGTIQIQLDKFASHGLSYRSGMLHSWNQLCFKGGIFEVSMSLPGPAGAHAYWPGVWTMGNLGRPGYLATTDGLWPYTYNDCDVGITPNQSAPDGISALPGQRLPSCSCAGEDHPTPGTGRGAPEIDIAEVSADWGGNGWAVATQSYQVAPFDIFYYPNYEFMETPNYTYSYVNTYTGGPYQQAVSTVSMLNNAWYDGNEYQTYSFEYRPGNDSDAYIAWVIGGEEMMKFDARAVGPNGNIGQRQISEEPMSIIMNLGFSNSWVAIDWSDVNPPTVMRIDYVRWYQPEDQQMVTCDPPGYETTEYIANHPLAYKNANYTRWADTGYSQPTNTFMDGCSA